MKSIKPGRGPSFMGGISAVAAVIFGLFWTITAASMGAPGIFPLFGVVFIIMGIAQAIYNFKNATGRNRFSTFDITDEREEPDPLNEYYHQSTPSEGMSPDGENNRANYCPYCGAPVHADHSFCKQCGKKIS